MTDIIMPKMSDGMEEGKVLRWIKHEGDEVEKGEPIAEIETDKANVELEAPESGVIQEIKASEGEIVPIGTPIAVVAPAGTAVGVKGGATAPAPPQKEVTAPPPPEPKASEERPIHPQAEELQPDGGIKASPLARKIAQDAGVDLERITGTGPGGRIVEADVKEFIDRGLKPSERRPPDSGGKQPVPNELEVPGFVSKQAEAIRQPTPPPAAHEMEISHMWETIGRRMTESKQRIPHFYVTMDVDMEEALHLREWLNSARPEGRKITINDIIIKACALALIKHPMMNASYEAENKLKLHESIDIGIATAIPNGLITPVVRNCERKSLSAISDEARELIVKTRNGSIRPDEYSGATFTITNLGMYGVEEFTAIIVPPQAAILAAGAAEPRPVVVEDHVEIRQRMTITVSADHRVIDGARVAEFMKDVKEALERPMNLVE